MDMHGYDKLYQYRLHPRVIANRYLYLHDTCISNPDFYSKTNKIKLKDNEIKTCKPPYSNIALFWIQCC